MKNMTKRYAAWTRRQGSQLNCGHVVTAGAVAAVVFALVLAWAIERYWIVITQVFWGCVAAAGLAGLTWTALAVRARLRSARLRAARDAAPAAPAVPPCARACGRPAASEVTWANGVRHSIEYLCEPCWAATDDQDRRTLAASAACPPELREVAGHWAAAEAAALRAGLAPASDNRAADDAHTAAELARVLEQAAPVISPRHWTRGHP